MSGSAATLRPTCFMITADRRPAKLLVRATSNATFSLMDHSR